MKPVTFFKKRIYCTILVTVFIWTLLLWDYFHGGVPSHHLLQNKDLPAFSNWWGRCFTSFVNLVLAVPRPSANWERSIEQRFTKQFCGLFCRRFAFWNCTFGIFYSWQSRCAFLYASRLVSTCFFLAYLPSRMFTWFCNWNDLYFWWCSPNSYWNYFSTPLQRSVFSTSTYGTLCLHQNCHPTS